MRKSGRFPKITELRLDRIRSWPSMIHIQTFTVYFQQTIMEEEVFFSRKKQHIFFRNFSSLLEACFLTIPTLESFCSSLSNRTKKQG